MKAIWSGTVIAESEETVVVENNHYFPPGSVNMELLKESENTSECPWKGHANYFDVIVGEEVNKDAAWIYKDPSEAAKNIQGFIAFWKGVEVIQ